jgi:hypothetical protein
MTPRCVLYFVAGFGLLLAVAVSGCHRSSAVPDSPNAIAAHVLDSRVAALKPYDSGDFEEVERRLAELYGKSSGQADEAVVILMSFYLGEHNGEELYENLLSRGPRMIPIIERYLQEPPSLLGRYPKDILLERTTTVLFLKESLEILKVQAGARRIESTSVETAPLRKQGGSCELKLLRRPAPNFPDDLIQSGETYRSTPVLRAQIEENGAVTNAEIIQQSGIKRLDVLLLKNIGQWKYAPRRGCGVVQSNIAITIDWTNVN